MHCTLPRPTMTSKRLIAISLCGFGLGACRLAGPDELVGAVPAHTTSVEAGVTGAPEEIPTAPRLDAGACVAPSVADPSRMVDVPPGSFARGCSSAVDEECKADEKPAHPVALGGFRIDATEVTQGQYNDCVLSGACLAPTCDWAPCGERAVHPVVCINRVDALAYCEHVGKRLPTEAEWEKAARGDTGLKFPWGNDPIDCAHANLAGCSGGTEPVGSHPTGASPYGALDMAGNVVEWVSDVYDPTYYGVSPATDPTGPAATATYGSFVGRGGGWNSTAIWHRTSARDDYEGTYFKKTFGVRCASNIP
jgi:formylglycine-generating enzyme required for sulfatase activity